MAGKGSDIVANALLDSLTAGQNFDITLPDLSGDQFKIPVPSTEGIFAPITKITTNDLTTRQVGGQGVFDALMDGFKAHLQKEYDSNRISGAEYTKAYIALAEAAMANATQFLLGKDQAYWQAVTAQIQAQQAQVAIVTARIALETAKVQLKTVAIEAGNAEATFALTKIKLATEDTQYATLIYNLDNILPLQKTLAAEQVESARAQTLDTRSDGSAVAGSVGMQSKLYGQQIISYKRDAEVKAAKLFTDAFITMKTIDEGLLPPTQFQNTSLDAILTDIKTNNDIG